MPAPGTESKGPGRALCRPPLASISQAGADALPGAVMTAETIVSACVLIIGNEILSGRTQDANLAYIATGLHEVGVTLREARVIPYVAEIIITTLNDVRARYHYVFTTGGIGPTHDDITSECVAKAFG